MRADLKRLKRQTASQPSIAVPRSGAAESHRWPQLRWLALLGLLAIVIVALAFWFLAPLPAPKVLSLHASNPRSGTEVSSFGDGWFAPVLHDAEKDRMDDCGSLRLGWGNGRH